MYIAEEGIAQAGGGGGLGRLREFLIKEGRASKL